MIAWLIILAMILAALHMPLTIPYSIFCVGLVLYAIQNVREKKLSIYVLLSISCILLVPLIHLLYRREIPGPLQLSIMTGLAVAASYLLAGARMVITRVQQARKNK